MPTSRTTPKRKKLKGVVGQAIRQQVAFVGPLGVGKTTAVRSISDVPVVSTEVMRSGLPAGSRRARKLTTTVGIDYGEWTPPGGERVALLGTPGQARFNEARASALADRTQIVLWLFGDHEYVLDECREWLQFLGEGVWPRLTVAITRRDTAENPPDLATYRGILDAYDERIALVTGDPRDAESVGSVIEAALAQGDAPGGERRA